MKKLLFTLALGTLGCQSAPEEAPTRTCTAVVIRHAEAFTNVGQTDGLTDEQANALTPKGVQQAEDLSDELKSLGLEVLISSEIGRAQNTAKVLAEDLGLTDVIVDARFNMLSRGDDPNPEIGSWDWRVTHWKAGQDRTPPNGESMKDGVERVNGALQEYCKAHKRFGVVTHSDVIAGVRASNAGTSLMTAHESMMIDPADFVLLSL
jgi:broad specificity phosphatase PhoE